MNHGIRGLVLSACFVLISYVLIACGNGPPPYDDEGRLGPSHQAYISSISIPSVVPVNEEQAVRVNFHPYGLWELESEEIHIDEATRTITIVILIREEMGRMMFSTRAASYDGDGNVERVFRVTFTELGTWTIKCNDLIGSVVVRGDWTGDEGLAEITSFEVPPIILTGYSIPVRLKLAHPNDEWFFRRVDKTVDEDDKVISLTLFEGKAESVLPAEPWQEDVEVELVFPSDGRWEIQLNDKAFSIRHVIQGEPPPHYELEQYIWYSGHTVRPSALVLPDSVHAMMPAECDLMIPISLMDTRYTGVDMWFDPPNRAIYGRAWVAYKYDYEPTQTGVEYREEVSLTFTEPGQWMVVFTARSGEPFIRVVNVLPVEE